MGTIMMAYRGPFMSKDSRVSVLAFDVYGTLIDPFRMEVILRAVFVELSKEAMELCFKSVACSKWTENAVLGLLEHAGVLARFSGIVSVDPIRTFKPDPAVYEYLAAQVQAEKEATCLVSSNPFDVIGAKACGLRTA